MNLRLPSELSWLSKQVRPYLRWQLSIFLCLGAGSLLALLTPLVLRWLIDQVLPQRHTGLLLYGVILIFLGNECRMAASSLGSYLTWTAGQQMALKIRLELLLHADQLSADFYEKTTPGAVMYLFKEPVDEVAYFGSDLLPSISRTMLSTSVTVGTMFILSPRLTWAVLPLIPIFLITRQHFRKRLANNSDTVQVRLAEWSSFLEEHFSSILAVQLLGRERRQERAAFRLLARATRSQMRLFQSATWFTACTSLALTLAFSAAIGYGGWKVISGTLSLGSMVAFYGFVAQLFDPLSGLAELYARSQKAFAGIRQLQSLSSLQATIVDSDTAIRFPRSHWGVEFTGVEFDYAPPRETLRIPALQILPGERLAIVGENGAGKSTLGKLLVRAYDVSKGSICIGDADIRTIRLRDLRRSVCYLPRDPVLFDGSIASNLRLVRPASSDQTLLHAIQQAALTDFLNQLPNGLQQRIGHDGCQLSGGQRQRLGIARAILQHPCILILDEATSCLDPDSETQIFGNLQLCLPSTTIVVVSHRPSTISMFDRILTLSHGRILADRRCALSLSRRAVVCDPSDFYPTSQQ